MRDNRGIGRAENYTTAALVSLGVLLFCALFAIYAAYGLIGVFLTAFGADRLLRGLRPRPAPANTPKQSSEEGG